MQGAAVAGEAGEGEEAVARLRADAAGLGMPLSRACMHSESVRSISDSLGRGWACLVFFERISLAVTSRSRPALASLRAWKGVSLHQECTGNVDRLARSRSGGIRGCELKPESSSALLTSSNSLSFTLARSSENRDWDWDASRASSFVRAAAPLSRSRRRLLVWLYERTRLVLKARV